MIPGFEIMCANKNQQGIIVRIGGEGWSLEAREAMVKLMSTELRLIMRINNEFVDIGIRGEGFDSYLVLEPDGFPLHALTDLQSC